MIQALGQALNNARSRNKPVLFFYPVYFLSVGDYEIAPSETLGCTAEGFGLKWVEELVM